VGKKSWLLRETISALDRRLTPNGFVRIHRSTSVNAQTGHGAEVAAKRRVCGGADRRHHPEEFRARRQGVM
jgi:RNA:NAD 2'-phosphotransferase (TPT1/KptA family)